MLFVGECQAKLHADVSVTYRCQSDEVWAIPCEVIGPRIAPRMEQANDLAGVRIYSRNVWPFEAIAVNTGQGEIVRNRLTAVLPCNHVIDLERRRVKLGCKAAVLTTSIRSRAYQSVQIGTQEQPWV